MKPNNLKHLKDEGGDAYFELQAYVGTTKHMGGFATTKTLIAMLNIGPDTDVLDVGCGAGATPCYLAKTFGCHVVGVDLRAPMVALATERAAKEGVADRVELKVADALALPFEDATFDVVMCESVATFIEDKAQVLREFTRVTKAGGMVGLNEEFWLEPPPDEVAAYVKRAWGIQSTIITEQDWRHLLEAAGLQDLVHHAYQLDTRREATQIQRYHVGEIIRMFYRTLVLYIKNPAFRDYMQARKKPPKGTFTYLGYGVFVGRKP